MTRSSEVRAKPSPRGSQSGRPFFWGCELTLDAATGALVGVLNGAPVRVERDPDDRNRWVLMIEIASALARMKAAKRGRARPTSEPTITPTSFTP